MESAPRAAHDSGEHELFRQQMRRFATEEVAPLVAEAEEQERFPRQVLERMGELGYIGLHVPERLGGPGGDRTMVAICAEELAKVCAGINSSVGVCTIAANPLLEVGTPAQQELYLRPVLRGRKIAAIAMSEPDAGSDFKAIRTRAEPREGGWVLNGTKTFITNGPNADFVVVCARTEWPAAGQTATAKGISLFIVERGEPGFAVSKKLKKLGLRSSETGELVFQDCFVPADRLVGQLGQGFYHIMHNLAYERLLSAAGSLGTCTASFEVALRYAGERRAFGKTINQFQMIRKLLVDMHTRAACARHLVYDAAQRLDRGEKAILEVSTAKYHAAEMAKLNAMDALQIHGGNGFMMEFPVQRYLRDSQVGTIAAGSSQIMVEIIAKQLGM